MRSRPPRAHATPRVAPDPQLRARVDRYYLDYLFREWQWVPQIAQHWDSWQDHEQLNFVVEWPIREDCLGELQQWAEHGALTPEQGGRYGDLMRLVAEHRPTLERLLED